MVDLGFKPNLSLEYDPTTIIYSLPNNVRYADTSEATGGMAFFDSNVFKSQVIDRSLLHLFLRLQYSLHRLELNKLQSPAASHSFSNV